MHKYTGRYVFRSDRFPCETRDALRILSQSVRFGSPACVPVYQVRARLFSTCNSRRNRSISSGTNFESVGFVSERELYRTIGRSAKNTKNGHHGLERHTVGI